jgi:hypothetical protein
LVTWISEDESKLKCDGEEFDDRSVIRPALEVPLHVGAGAARIQADLLPETSRRR